MILTYLKVFKKKNGWPNSHVFSLKNTILTYQKDFVSPKEGALVTQIFLKIGF
jgi:hypothetical protein